MGTVQPSVGSREADVAWVIGVPWQGNGYAKEAARVLVDWVLTGGAPCVTARIHPQHAASAAAAAAGLADGRR